MKQIEFTLEAFGPDGLLKEGYEVKNNHSWIIDFIRLYQGIFVVVFNDGSVRHYSPCEMGNQFTMYRRTRTAEEVAMETFNNSYLVKNGNLSNWDRTPKAHIELFTILVQAGMDEMKKP